MTGDPWRDRAVREAWAARLIDLADQDEHRHTYATAIADCLGITPDDILTRITPEHSHRAIAQLLDDLATGGPLDDPIRSI